METPIDVSLGGGEVAPRLARAYSGIAWSPTRKRRRFVDRRCRFQDEAVEHRLGVDEISPHLDAARAAPESRATRCQRGAGVGGGGCPDAHVQGFRRVNYVRNLPGLSGLLITASLAR